LFGLLRPDREARARTVAEQVYGAVAGYVAGGRAALTAIDTAGYDVMAVTPRPGKGRTLVELARAFARGR